MTEFDELFFTNFLQKIRKSIDRAQCAEFEMKNDKKLELQSMEIDFK